MWMNDFDAAGYFAPVFFTPFMEICTEYLEKGYCTSRSSCPSVHHRKPFWWQISWNDGQKWEDFTESDCDEVEKAYCEPKNDKLESVLQSKLDVCFVKMEAISGNRKAKIRRVSTVSVGQNPNAHLPTEYKWYFKDVLGNWVEYGKTSPLFRGLAGFDMKSDVNSDKLERHYSSQPSNQPKQPLFFQTAQHKYRVDFDTMFQVNLNPTFGTKREVKRRPVYREFKELPPVAIKREEKLVAVWNDGKKSRDVEKLIGATLSKPTLDSFRLWQEEHEKKKKAGWDELKARGKHGPGKDDPELMATTFRLVAVSEESTEFAEMLEVLKRGSGKSRLLDRTKTILRVENSVLEARFAKEKEKMVAKHRSNPDWAKEKYLFHGTKEDRVESICKINFDLEIAGTSTGALHGRGVYFSTTATGAALFGSCILVCRALPGRHYSGPTKEDWEQAPLVPGSSVERYDSVGDNANNPAVHIIYEENKILPAYVAKL